MYLLHVPAARIGRAVLSVVTPVEPQSALAAAVMFGASILAASISWRFFESKLLVLKDRFTG
jgi:peptidoglycan/LPS O-acetylase OafA/YrhL